MQAKMNCIIGLYMRTVISGKTTYCHIWCYEPMNCFCPKVKIYIIIIVVRNVEFISLYAAASGLN